MLVPPMNAPVVVVVVIVVVVVVVMVMVVVVVVVVARASCPRQTAVCRHAWLTAEQAECTGSQASLGVGGGIFDRCCSLQRRW